MSERTLLKILRKADDCLEDAKFSFEESSFEASVNRSYYSIFHLIQALLFVSNIVSKTHVGAHNKFRELFIKTSVLDTDLSVMLQRSFEQRQFSDYDYDEVFQDDALQSLEDAQHFRNVVILYLKKNNFLQ